jgi:hypothetical protein
MNWVLRIMSCTLVGIEGYSPVGTAGQIGKILMNRAVGADAYLPV